MSFRESFYATKQLLVNRLQDFGLVSANMNMGWTTLLTIAQNTRVTIDVPLILTYSDAFLISGTLETSTYSRLNGKTVKLKVGNTIVDTTTTNINGEYSFTHSPVSTGNHSFQVIFEGTNIHAASESSVVTRSVGKETSVMNLDAISTQHWGDTVVFGGQLLTDNGEYISNASVKYYLDNTLIDTLTTNAQGRFSISETINDFDTLYIDFIYDGDSNYVDCSANTSINIYQKVLSLTADKSILDYSSNESAILTAQIKDTGGQNLSISGEEVEFGIVNDKTPSSSSSTIQSTMLVLEYTGSSIKIGHNSNNWLPSEGDVIVDWGDGTTDTINNPTTQLTHTYSDGENNHTIRLIGEITCIANGCFSGCTGLTNIIFSNSITSLGIGCFSGCTGLTSITIPNNIISIEGSCFVGCTGLTSIILPDNITNLSNNCFTNCSSLTSIDIPESVTSIGEACFYGCSSLTEVIIPESVTNLESDCFRNCTGLVDYQLYWTGNNIINYNANTMPANTGTIFTIPQGETSNYIAKGYPSYKLQERSAIPTTDSTGKATYTYESTGAGDVTIYAQCGLLQETFVVQDCHFYDTASTDKSSSYVAKPLGTHLISNSISYANNEYTVSSNVDSTAWTGVNPSVSLSTEDNWVFSAKVKSKAFPSIGLGDGVQKHIEMIRYPLNGNWAVYGYISPNSYLVSNKNLSSSSNTYYTHEISLENGVFTFKIYDTNGNLLDSATIQLPPVYENSTVYPVISTFPNANDTRSITFKDVKIKAL